MGSSRQRQRTAHLWLSARGGRSLQRGQHSLSGGGVHGVVTRSGALATGHQGQQLGFQLLRLRQGLDFNV